MTPEPIRKFTDAFARLPGIGPRQATRLAFHVKSLGEAAISELAAVIDGLKAIQTCERCFFTHDTSRKNTCPFCDNPQRNQSIIAVVEKETDVISIEKTKKYGGRYLILGELKKDGLLDDLQKLKLASLKSWIGKELAPSTSSGRGLAEEIIIAISPTTYGDINAGMIAQELKGAAKKMTRLGRGIPTGGEIEFADEDTLSAALDNRA